MTAIYNIIYKHSAVTEIVIGFGLVEGIKIVINVFTFILSCGIPRLNKLK